jgi:glycine hydroxymethyltransferase
VCREAFAKAVDRAIFPGSQGGPLMHVIAAKAVAFKEAMQPDFADYQCQIVANARALAEELADQGLRIVSGGTDNHLLLVDLSPVGVTGRDAERALDDVGITVNKNLIPYDERSPRVCSGIRLGTPAVTTRGFREDDVRRVGRLIATVVRNIGDEAVYDQVRAEVRDLCGRFPVPGQ